MDITKLVEVGWLAVYGRVSTSEVICSAISKIDLQRIILLRKDTNGELFLNWLHLKHRVSSGYYP